jgi:hypothetical protein
MLEQEREARRRELGMLAERRKRYEREIAELVREADARGDWQRAGCSSSAEWLAQIRADAAIAVAQPHSPPR